MCNCAEFGSWIATAIDHSHFHWLPDKPRFLNVSGSMDEGYESVVECPDCKQQWRRSTRSSGHAEIDTLERI
jgi:hypothetical protein